MALADYLASFLASAIIVWFGWRKIWPPLSRAAKQRQETVAKQVEDSKLATERLKAAEQSYRDALAEARTEAAKIRDAARADAQRIVEEMRAQAEREVERIKQRGEEDLVTQRQQVIRELRGRIGELSVTLAGELVSEHLSGPGRQAATVDNLLGELEAMASVTPSGSPRGDARSHKGDA